MREQRSQKMEFDIGAKTTPLEARRAIREGRFARPTSGVSAGYAQCNLAAMPKGYADDFLEFTRLNPAPCPVLGVTDVGVRTIDALAKDADIARDIPKYRLYEYGKMTRETTDGVSLWRDDLVAFLIGCSFSFEAALLEAGLPVRHIEMGRNVPMYDTNIALKPYGAFFGNMVVSMRPMKPEQALEAERLTARFPRVHGAPIHMGDPAKIGISDIMKPDYGDSVDIREGEIPVFWPCGVTPQAVVMRAKLPYVVTHSPGHMFITDVLNKDLAE